MDLTARFKRWFIWAFHFVQKSLVIACVFFALFVLVFVPLRNSVSDLTIEPLPLPEEFNETEKWFVFNWVSWSIDYENDFDEDDFTGVFISNSLSDPKSTLEAGKGNCYEKARLTCALMRYYGHECWLKSLVVYSSDFSDSYGHMIACTTDSTGSEVCVD